MLWLSLLANAREGSQKRDWSPQRSAAGARIIVPASARIEGQHELFVPQSILMRDATPNLNIDHIPLRQDREDAPPRGTDEQCVIRNTTRKTKRND